MKKLITGLLSCFAVVLLIVPMSYAQTPDGQTPANEGVCDVLQADGTTKGLYGLCIAYCEAQDHTSEDTPITGDDFEALLDMRPAGKILANYNKRRQEGDAGMPCIKVEEPCPCWTAEELASIDGTMYDGSAASINFCVVQDFGTSCPTGSGVWCTTEANQYEFSDTTPHGQIYTQAFTYRTNYPGQEHGYCTYKDRFNNPDPSVWIDRQIFLPGPSHPNGQLTEDQWFACRDQVAAHIIATSSTCNAP